MDPDGRRWANSANYIQKVCWWFACSFCQPRSSDTFSINSECARTTNPVYCRSWRSQQNVILLLSFDVNILNVGDGKYQFNIHRKDAITNVQIKPHSCINPGIVEGVFKEFLVRAHRLCSPNYIQDEINFLVNVFSENGHARSVLKDITKTFIIPENRLTQPPPPNTTTSADSSTDAAKIVKLPWIPRLGPKLRKISKSTTSKLFSHHHPIFSLYFATINPSYHQTVKQESTN